MCLYHISIIKSRPKLYKRVLFYLFGLLGSTVYLGNMFGLYNFLLFKTTPFFPFITTGLAFLSVYFGFRFCFDFYGFNFKRKYKIIFGLIILTCCVTFISIFNADFYFKYIRISVLISIAINLFLGLSFLAGDFVKKDVHTNYSNFIDLIGILIAILSVFIGQLSKSLSFLKPIEGNFGGLAIAGILHYISLAKDFNNDHIKLLSDIEDKIYIKADPHSLDRMVNNILDNAYKYTEKEGEIKLTLKSTENQIFFSVEDTGIGISEEQQEKIFLPYYQISHKKRNLQGIGMGLNIVKKIIDSLNGTIEVKSNLEKGSVFTVILKKYIIKENDKIQTTFENTEPVTKPIRIEIPKDVYEKGKFTLLIIEDNPDMLSYLYKSLIDSYNIYCALNGKEAYRKLFDMPQPDIIISDIMMDEMDGYEFYEIVKSIERYNYVPFIFLTAKSTQEDKIKGLEQGAIDYICKPFSVEELTAKINSILSTKKAQKYFNIDEVKDKVMSVFNKIHINDEDERFSIFKKTCSNYNVTTREEDILHQLFKGLENKEICNVLDISIDTVKTHVRNIFKKCNVQNRIELIRLFSDSL